MNKRLAERVLRTLAGTDGLTAKRLAASLRVRRLEIYRALKWLLEEGCVFFEEGTVGGKRGPRARVYFDVRPTCRSKQGLQCTETGP